MCTVWPCQWVKSCFWNLHHSIKTHPNSCSAAWLSDCAPHLIIFNVKLLHHINAVKESAQCVCVFFLHVLCYVRLCVSSPLFYVSRRSPAEQKKKLNQISINMFHLYVPTLVSHTQTLNSLCVNLASSGLLSLEADCQHQCVRGESYLGLTSAAPIPRMRTVVFACVCTEQEVCIRAAVTGLPMP